MGRISVRAVFYVIICSRLKFNFELSVGLLVELDQLKTSIVYQYRAFIFSAYNAENQITMNLFDEEIFSLTRSKSCAWHDFNGLL